MPSPCRKHSSLVPVVACAAVLWALAAGCGGGSKDAAAPSGSTRPPERSASTSTAPPSTRPAPVDPCTLVTKDEAAAVTGAALEDGTSVGVGTDSASCMFTGSPSGPTAQFEVFVGPGAEKYLDIDRDLGHEFTAVEGIGDEAHREEMNIFVRKGSTWFGLRVTRLEDPSAFDQPLEALARTVADRI
ncbi:MAG: DUF3558 family protein [Acidimicrobiia bacterium]|nr:DUF3558 family protein [Acidimicrobiia bacterium]